MTLHRLWNEVSEDELLLWSLYFGFLNKQQDQAIKDAKRRR
jgi:hypothetical protein